MALAVTIGSRWGSSAMPKPSRTRVVTAATAVRTTKGSSERLYSSGSTGPLGCGVWSTGMCVCSVTKSASNPRSSTSRPRATGAIVSSVTNMETPKRIGRRR